MVGVEKLTRKKFPFLLALLICLAMYIFDLSVLQLVPTVEPFSTANFALPFDLMVCVPLVFYLLVVRPRGISPIAVLPVIYLGGLISSFIAVADAPSLLPVLFGVAFAVDILVLTREVPRLAKAFRQAYRQARKNNPYPITWFNEGFKAIFPFETAGRIAAMETAMWYYLLFSWRRRTAQERQESQTQCSQAFTYHKNNGIVPLIGVIVSLGVVEIVVVHMLVVQYSPLAALLLSAISIYGLAWLASSARSIVLTPLLISHDSLIATWGFSQCERIPLNSIERVALSDPGFTKQQTLNMTTMGAKPCWVVLKKPLTIRGFLGAPREIHAIMLSPDDLQGFIQCITQAASA